MRISHRRRCRTRLAVTVAFVRACGGDAAEWEERWHALAADSAAPALREQQGGDAPYPGLSAYGVEDADRFFGREKLITDLRKRLTERRFVAVFGPSGSGKSSLLRAGMVPGLSGRVVLFTPVRIRSRSARSAWPLISASPRRRCATS